jgi:hypothetical protein
MINSDYKKYLKKRYKEDRVRDNVAGEMGFDSYNELKFRNRRKVNKELRKRMKKELATSENTGLYTINTK